MKRKLFLALFFSATQWAPAQETVFPTPPPLPPPVTRQPASDQDDSIPKNTVLPTPQPVLITPPTPTLAPTPNSGDAPITAGSLSSMEALDDKVLLRDGDRISFRVIEDQDEPVPRIVTDTGEVDFPYVGRLRVEGKSCREVAQELKRMLEVDYYKRATVIVGLDVIYIPPPTPPTPAPIVTRYTVWVVGQVRSVGPQEFTKEHPLTVSQVILSAGGFGDFADQKRVHLIHRSPSDTAVTEKGGETLDIKAVFDGKQAPDPLVQANDLIVVPKKLVNF